MPGRKPTPHYMKAVTGNPGKRPMGDPPAKVAGEVSMPPLLVAGEFEHVERARQLWEFHAPTLIALEILNPLTAAMFGNWCEMQARYESAPAAFTAALMGQLRYLASSFGLDAVSWEKLTAGKGKDEGEDDEFFGATG